MNTRLVSLRRPPMRVPAFVLILCLALLAVSSASAQTSTTGSIEGTVTDSTGAAVPGITVTANGRGGSTGSSTTNDEGFFRITNLQPGRYTVAVEASKGFAKFEQANVEVNLSRSANVGIQLRPAGAAESVAVTPTTTGANASVKTADGLRTISFEPKAGTVRVILPDDMRAGDTISGTLVSEPKGQTPEERAKNGSELKGLTLEIDGKMVEPFSAPPLKERESVIQQTFWIYHSHENRLKPPATAAPVTDSMATSESGRDPRFSIRLVTGDAAREEVGRITIPYTPVFPTTPSGGVITPDPKITPTFYFPVLGQSGRPIIITGPFDGDSANTSVSFRTDRNIEWDKVRSSVTDFEKNTENVAAGFGLIKPLAESPRMLVFEVPANLIGPIELNVKDGSNEASGTHRNVGVRLSAPKTSLLKGEKTTLTTEVSGLQGITKAVPLTLTSEGVITMEGGPFQQLQIQPSEVNASGKYTTTRQVTGIMAGGWGATATVVTRRFNIWLQDDSDPNRLFHFNSFTGDYIFACGGGSCRNGAGETSSQPPTGSSVTPPPVTLTGLGKPQMKGCIITLSHNAPDRRVFARLDACTKSGDASVETKSPKANFNITDKNTTDNTTSPPPK